MNGLVVLQGGGHLGHLNQAWSEVPGRLILLRFESVVWTPIECILWSIKAFERNVPGAF